MQNDGGPLLEGWVHMLLRAYGQEAGLFDELAYWAPVQSRKVEVDFLLQRQGELLALEVKAHRRFSPSLLAGLKAIGELPAVVRRVLLYTGERELRTPEGIAGWPLSRFLRALESDTLWP